MGRGSPILLLCLAALLSACGGEKPRAASAPLPATTAEPAVPVRIEVISRPVPEPEVLRLPGLDGVIGASAAVLLGEFGAPRIDLREGDVRKLQFSGAPCVLDIYLYPPDGGGEPVATHIEARRGSDGLDVDRASCVEALMKRS